LKKIFSVAIAILILITATACEKIGNTVPVLQEAVESQPNYPVKIDGISFEKAPETVISLSPALTEILFEIGVGEKLIGRSSYCNYPENVAEIESVGSPAKPDIDKILQLSPEALVTQSPIAKIDLNILEKNGIKVITVPSPKNYYEMLDSYAKLALVFLGNNFANEITTEKFATLDGLLSSAQEMNLTDSFVFIITPDLAVATGDTLSGNIISVFGENIAKEHTEYKMSVEEIVTASPTRLFISKDIDINTLPQELLEIPAIKNGNIITVDYSFFERPTTRISEVVKAISEKLAPVAPVPEVTQAETSQAESTETSQ